MKRKLLAMLLSVIMLISILPAPTFATEDVGQPSGEQVISTDVPSESTTSVESATTTSTDTELNTTASTDTETNTTTSTGAESTTTDSTSAESTEPAESTAPVNTEPTPSAESTPSTESATTDSGNDESTEPTKPAIGESTDSDISDNASDSTQQISNFKLPFPSPTSTSDPQKSFETATFSHIDLRIHTAKLTINNVITDENGNTISSSSSTITAHLTKINSCKVDGTSVSGNWSWGSREARISYKTYGSSLQTISFNVDLEDNNGNVYSNVEITFGLDGIKAAAKNCDGYDSRSGKYDGLDFDLSTNASHTTTCTSAGLKIEVVKKISENGQVSSFSGNGGEFSFALNCTNDSKKSQTVSVDANGKASFTLSFGYSDVGKTFSYTLTESKSDSSLYEANTQSYSFSVNVTKSESSGKITIKPTLVGSSTYTFTNVKIPQTTSVSVSKVWDDADNQDGKRPDSVTVTLYADGNATDNKVTLNASNSWTAAFTNLPKYSGGNEIDYTVVEETVAGYNASVAGSVANGFTITNSRTPETIASISVKKVWSDADNQDGKRPDSVTVTLYADGSATNNKVTLNASNSWTAAFTNLPKYSGGNEITYTVVEETVAGYTASVAGSVANGFTITNSRTPETIASISVKKVWSDNNDQDGKRPDSVTVTLYADGSATNNKVTLNASNSWTAAFTNLPKYSGGNEIAYTVVEETVAGYTASVAGSVANGFTITNSRTPETTSVSVSKVWVEPVGASDELEVIRPESVTVNVMNGTDVVATAEIKPDGNGNWSHTFDNLPKYKNGEPISYTVTETNVADGYTFEVTGDAANGFTITNYYAPVTEVTVRKVWEGDEGKEANRPAEITVRLKADGQIIKELKLSAGANTPWYGSFEDLPVYNSNGQKVVYTVEEAAVENYTATVEEVEDYFFDIINTLIPETTSVKVTKVWDDMGDYDRLRPDSITVQLLLNGKERIGEPVELNEANKWSHTFTDLLKYDDAEFTYTIDEVDVPKGYTSKVTGDATNGFTITNTHTVTPVVSTTSRTVIKNWKDDNDSRGQRPTSVKVHLYADGKAFGAPVVITERDGWTYTFSGLPIARDGKEIVYTVKEIDVPAHYYAKYSSDTFTITNVYSVMPKTGVEENTAIWWALAALSVLAIIGVQTVDKKRRSC